MPECPDCQVPGERHLVFVDGIKDGRHRGWQEYRPCHTCGGTNEISEERARWIEEGKQMHRERVARRESLREMGERIGIDYCRLSRIEAGMEPMPEVRNCMECAVAKLTADHMGGYNWGECYHDHDSPRAIPVADMVRGDGRIIAPDWCPRRPK